MALFIDREQAWDLNQSIVKVTPPLIAAMMMLGWSRTIPTSDHNRTRMFHLLPAWITESEVVDGVRVEVKGEVVVSIAGAGVELEVFLPRLRFRL
jgi:hypothetical protein